MLENFCDLQSFLLFTVGTYPPSFTLGTCARVCVTSLVTAYMNIPANFTLISKTFSTSGFHYKAFVEELWLYSFFFSMRVRRFFSCDINIHFHVYMLSRLLIGQCHTIYVYQLLLIGTLMVHRACTI